MEQEKRSIRIMNQAITDPLIVPKTVNGATFGVSEAARQIVAYVKATLVDGELDVIIEDSPDNVNWYAAQAMDHLDVSGIGRKSFEGCARFVRATAIVTNAATSVDVTNVTVDIQVI